ncbi:MAG TPA: metallophosphoesterase [Vicinamibacterales bacterium]|nr:metallophosphoesterase [Vicinamibacterales bacterium]
MRRLFVLLQMVLLSGCGNSWIGQTSEAREQPRLQVLAVEDVPRDAVTLPNADRSIKFAIIGDSGRGSKQQHEVAAQMAAYRQRFSYDFVLMAGDNIYEGPASEDDYRLKFEEPYKALLDAGVKFYAALGNHDDTNQIYYKPFNMDGRRYYTFVPPVDPITRWETRVRFFSLDSTYLNLEQLRWFEKETTESRAEWKIAFFHHPVYTPGRYTMAARGIRLALESSLVNGGVDVVFTGHEHIYARSEMQKGILYFVTGGAGSLREGDAQQSPAIARSYDRDYHFMLAEITDDGFFFQAINRLGATIDAGSLLRPVTTGTEARR